MLDSVKQQIDSFIDELNDARVKEIYNELPFGKMLRSKLVFLIAPDSKLSVKISAIIELIHLSSLLHDDVIDEATTRRGKQSINSKYGNFHSVMLGDIFYSKAFYELSKLPQNIAQTISQAVTNLSLGELMDVELANSFNEDSQQYYKMIYLKTAALIEASAVSGAIIANKDIKKYQLFGKNLGIAFQIIDDILDVTQDEKTLGKPAFNDISEGKITLPILLLNQKLNQEDKKYLRSLFKKRLNQNEIMWIQERLRSFNIIDEVQKIAFDMAYEAKDAIKDNKGLIEIINKMISRSF